MPRLDDAPTCTHCRQAMTAMALPEAGGWDDAFHWVCFNDGCSYYGEGWDWMWEHYRVRCSYRHRVDPSSGKASPLPVWSQTALRDRIQESNA